METSINVGHIVATTLSVSRMSANLTFWKITEQIEIYVFANFNLDLLLSEKDVTKFEVNVDLRNKKHIAFNAERRLITSTVHEIAIEERIFATDKKDIGLIRNQKHHIRIPHDFSNKLTSLPCFRSN